MNKRRTEILILFGFVITALLIGAASLYAIRDVQILAGLVKESNEPGFKINAIQTWLAEMNEAESRLRIYVLTQENRSLVRFYNKAEKADDEFENLREVFPADKQLDTINQLIGQKVDVLNELIPIVHALKANNPYELLEDEISDELKNEGLVGNFDSAVDEQESSERQLTKKEERKLKREKKKESKNESEGEPKPKTGLLRRIFRYKKIKKEIDEINQQVSAEKRIQMLEDLIYTSDSIRREAAEEEAEQIKTVQRLSNEEAEINDKIREVLMRLKAQEEEKGLQFLEDAENRLNFIEENRDYFFIGIGSLILLLILLIFRGFGKNRRLAKNLGKARTEAENLAKAKEDFLANMSHEFRTPLNAISGFTEQLEKSALDRDQRRQLNIIQSSSNHLKAIINDVLDFSKITSGNFTLAKEPFPVKKIIRETIDIFLHKCHEKGLFYRLKWTNEPPAYVLGDSLRLKQMLINIIGNAIKFTDKGGIYVEIKSESKSKDSVQLEIKVRDTGIGIPKEKIDKMFDAFQQASSTTVQNYGGTGLGLPITRDIARLHGGEIQISSEEGQGTTVMLSLPYEIAKSSAKLLPESTGNNGVKAKANGEFSLKGAKIIIADDDMYNRELVAYIIRKYDGEPILLEDGEYLMMEIELHYPDFILADLNMPGVNGIDLAKKVNKQLLNPPPFYLWTASSSPDIQDQAINAGAKGVLLKPTGEDELIKVLNREIENYRRAQKKS